MQQCRDRKRRGARVGRGFRALGAGLLASIGLVAPAEAFRVIGTAAGWARWDAATRFVEGEERSLAGGLRYSVETGSYAGLRDQFLWFPEPPSDADFAAAVQRAFEHWEIIDPATGLPAAFHFVEDLTTPAVDDPGNPRRPNSRLGLNAGAEIDLFAETPHPGPGFAASVIFFVDSDGSEVTLSSGRTGYPGLAISGADIRINPAFQWTLRTFEVLLTHEIGHALGLADLEASVASGSVSGFLDDDYDPTSSDTALATLTNSFALSIDPWDPDASPLLSFSSDMYEDPGLLTSGVTLLMESEGLFDLAYASQKLQNDDLAGRQFLYPFVVPEPAMGLMLGAGAATLAILGRRRGRPAMSRPGSAAHGEE